MDTQRKTLLERPRKLLKIHLKDTTPANWRHEQFILTEEMRTLFPPRVTITLGLARSYDEFVTAIKASRRQLKNFK